MTGQYSRYIEIVRQAMNAFRSYMGDTGHPNRDSYNWECHEKATEALSGLQSLLLGQHASLNEAHGLISRLQIESAKRAICRDDLADMLRRYISAYPAFRMKPIGAPNSEKRIEQEMLMQLEDDANSLIKQSGE